MLHQLLLSTSSHHLLPIRWLCRFVPKPTFCNKRALSAARSVRCDCRRHGRCQPRHARSVAERTALIRCVADSQCRNYACWLHNSALRCNEADPVAHQCTARAQTHRPAPRSLGVVTDRSRSGHMHLSPHGAAWPFLGTAARRESTMRQDYRTCHSRGFGGYARPAHVLDAFIRRISE